MSVRGSRAPSIVLPYSSATSESFFNSNPNEYEELPVKWWPYRFLPNPYTLASTLFPTLCTWREKSVWDKFASVISAPSIFLLAITLPVVESESQEEDTEEAIEDERRESVGRSRRGTAPALVPDSPTLEQEEPEWSRYRRATVSHGFQEGSRARVHSTAEVAIAAEVRHHHPHLDAVPPKRGSVDTAARRASEPSGAPPKDWNRWLVAVQLFTAPLFVVLIAWANTEERRKRLLVQLVLYSLLGSLIALAILILTTSHSKPPRLRFLFCFVGFVVSIAWISTVANEVVGVLKAFGVILGISDAILGLTIFAVGNSLGDLVADITVARLGYPVMALSACFGGPMLNILLGIGVSGLYMTIKEAKNQGAKRPGSIRDYKPYHIEVSGTLIVSAITLLVTLTGLLIAVPLNKWIMSRRIGWGLIILWSISTIVNLGVEFSGVWGRHSLVS
jgi:sodium/potassium/calcium exchanger 6